MKKPTRTARVLRPLKHAELARTRGGITGMDDWEAPVASTVEGNKVWSDDWLAPI